MESHRDFSALSHDNIASSRFKPQKFVCLTLGYPLLTIVTPLLTLLLLYVLFDCLDEEMCFKTESHDPKSNLTAATFNDQSVTSSIGLTDQEIRLTCLLSFLFLSIFVGIFLVFRLRNRKQPDNDETDDYERIPILKADSH